MLKLEFMVRFKDEFDEEFAFFLFLRSIFEFQNHLTTKKIFLNVFV